MSKMAKAAQAWVAVASLVLLMPGFASATGPVSLTSCQDLQKIGNDAAFPLSGSYLLAQDIDCTADTSTGGALYHGGEGFAPIGDNSHPFTGTLNGQYHTITGLTFNRTSVDQTGLFSRADSATIENLQLANINYTGNSGIGGIVGLGVNVTVQNVLVRGSITSGGGQFTGMIIGYHYDPGSSYTSHLTHVYAAGTINGADDAVGGLVGFNGAHLVIDQSGSAVHIPSLDGGAGKFGGLVGESAQQATISQSFNTGSIGSSGASHVGGLVGLHHVAALTISDSYSTGAVTATDDTGGLVGAITGGTANLSRVYASGAVNGSAATGGLVGNPSGLTVQNSFWDTQTTTQSSACGGGGCTGATGLTSPTMATGAPFTGASWDYGTVWGQTNGVNSGDPYLQWAHTTTSTNPATAKTAQIIAADDCFVNHQALTPVSDSAPRDGFNAYPNGLMDFQLACATAPGFTTQVTLYFFGVTADQASTVRKYNPATQTYAAIPGATLSFVTIGGQPTAKVVYAITDGGPLDQDGLVNGVISDPIGLAVLPGAPNTGLGALAGSKPPTLPWPLALMLGTPAPANPLSWLLALISLAALSSGLIVITRRQTR